MEFISIRLFSSETLHIMGNLKNFYYPDYVFHITLLIWQNYPIIGFTFVPRSMTNGQPVIKVASSNDYQQFKKCGKLCAKAVQNHIHKNLEKGIQILYFRIVI